MTNYQPFPDRLTHPDSEGDDTQEKRRDRQPRKVLIDSSFGLTNTPLMELRMDAQTQQKVDATRLHQMIDELLGVAPEKFSEIEAAIAEIRQSTIRGLVRETRQKARQDSVMTQRRRNRSLPGGMN
jgi:hypothetical protein